MIEERSPASACGPKGEEPGADERGRLVEERIEEIRRLEQRLADLRRAMLAGDRPGITEVAEGDAGLALLLVRCGEHGLALPLAYVEEVVQMPALAAVPGGSLALAGLVNYHGEQLAVIDLGRLVGGEPTPVIRSQSLVICRVGGRRLAVQVSDVDEVTTVLGSSVRVTEELLPGALRTAGVVTVEGTAAHLVDLAWIAMGTGLSRLLAADGARVTGEPGDAEAG